jgi:transketolase
LVLSRQDLPVLEGTAGNDDVRRGAYVLERGGPARPEEQPDLILMGTGSEVHLCVDAARVLREVDGLDVWVVSMPSWDLFAAQSEAYRDSVLPVEVPTLAVEAASSFGWDRWADDVVSLDHFGVSAPGGVAMVRLGFSPEAVVDRARQLLDDLAPED